MPKAQLSAQVVNAAACPPGRGKLDIYDTAIPGFILEVRPSGGKTYHLRYRDPHGRQRQFKIGDAQSISFDRARTRAQQVRSRIVLGESPVDERRATRQVPTLEDFIRDSYIPHIRLHRRNYQSTLSFLRLHVHPHFGALHMDQLTPQMISGAHEGLKRAGYALSTVNKLPILLKTIYNLAIRMKVVGVVANPANAVKTFPVNNAKERYLTPEETQRLRAVLDEGGNRQFRHVVVLMLMLGCRKRELLDARWEDVDLDRRMWRIPLSKSGRPRNVPLSGAAVELLRGLPRWDRCPYVIPNPSTMKPYGNLHYNWDRVRRAAGMPDLRMHDLRHSFASNLVNSGRSIYEVGRLLGHTQVKTTQRYAHLSDATLMSAMEEAANAVHSRWSEGTRTSV